ncbi:MAG: recombinase family protein, partial [Lachnospiraceae bacterium]|nr:recombinase family protein [Lachnospiraceae bacterium]
MIKVASYCRVSTDREDQANSFESQRRYFREYIARHPEWELWKVYADEGISGTSTKKRTQFNRMINDAYLGKFKLIITKEVSRFSRNLLDTIAYTRELKSLGIGVIFMNDGFTSLDPDSELRLSIMGSIAQEESRKTSSRVKWGQTRQMERGVVFGTSMLGYDVCDGKLTINPEGAEIVRLIFHKYAVEQKGTSIIARELREAGIKTYSGDVIWNSSHIVRILRNEKYVGDLVQKKTITPDYLTHAKKKNKGEEEMITITDHHEPIIDRELWDKVQDELQKRNRNNGHVTGHSNRHIFSGKMICGECGARFIARSKTRQSGTSYKRWSCYTAATHGAKSVDSQGNLIGCDIGKTIRDDLAMEALTKAIKGIPVDFNWIIHNLTSIVNAAMSACDDPVDNVQKLERQIQQIMKKKEATIDAFLSGA